MSRKEWSGHRVRDGGMGKQPSTRYTKTSRAGKIVDHWFQNHVDERTRSAIPHAARRKLVDSINAELRRVADTLVRGPGPVVCLLLCLVLLSGCRDYAGIRRAASEEADAVRATQESWLLRDDCGQRREADYDGRGREW